jgi:hypothetical protein
MLSRSTSLPGDDQQAIPLTSPASLPASRASASAFGKVDATPSSQKFAEAIMTPNGSGVGAPQSATVPADSRGGFASLVADSKSESPSPAITLAASFEAPRAPVADSSARMSSEIADPRTANFAEETAQTERGNISAPAASDKIPLSIREEELVEGEPAVGTRVAKSQLAMSSAASPHREMFNASALTHAFVAPVASTFPGGSSETAPEVVKSAEHAVEAVLSLAERFATTDRHTVNLQFSIGGADLQVKVELRRDEVRTAFHTESPELRSALAHEWQAMNSAQSDRSIRFADPVFSASSREDENPTRFTHDSASQQQHREPAAQGEGGGHRGSFSRSRLPVTSPVPIAPLQSAPTTDSITRRLHTFA